MAKATQTNLDELRKKRETLEAEIAKVREQEAIEAERTLRGHAEALLKEAGRLGYGSWAYEGEGGSTVRIGKKRTSGGGKGNGHEVTVSKDGKEVGTFESAKKAADYLKLNVKGDSAIRVLQRQGYTVTKS